MQIIKGKKSAICILFFEKYADKVNSLTFCLILWAKFSTTVFQHDEKCSDLLQPRLSKIYNRQSLMKCILHKVRAIFAYLTTKVNPI